MVRQRGTSRASLDDKADNTGHVQRSHANGKVHVSCTRPVNDDPFLLPR